MSTCRTCEVAPLDCGTAITTYSLQEDTYFYQTHCPPGSICNALDEMLMECCDGVVLRVVFPPDATAALRDAILQALVAEYWKRWTLCQAGGTESPTSDVPDGNPEDPDNPLELYFNVRTVCTSKCPDGNSFTYVVPAGNFISTSQSSANASALSYACSMAKTHKICLGSLPTECCISQPFSQLVKASGSFLDANFNFWTLVSGTLPPGLDLKYQGYGPPHNPLTGTPTTAGNYTFTIGIRDPVGDYMTKTYSICVIAITSDPAGPDATHLPEVAFAEDYSVTMKATTCADSPLSWQIVSGALPTGLLLDEETGVISGTCLADPGQYVFTVRLQTRAT